jgi:hypothetical protein
LKVGVTTASGSSGGLVVSSGKVIGVDGAETIAGLAIKSLNETFSIARSSTESMIRARTSLA